MEEELIQYIAENLVNDPEQVKVVRKETNRSVVLELTVASDDMGRVIGRSGRVANAMRALLRALPGQDDDDDNKRGRGRGRQQKRVILEIE
jgi:predicted RNA-binding protein YlqC (UPF0109 family)